MKLEDNLNDLERLKELLDVSPVAIDLVTSICGKWIGSGSFRSVFEYNLDPRYVVKIEPLNTNCNLIEYLVYEEVKGLMNELEWVKDWFAPVKWISPNGRILLMKKTNESNKAKPIKVPSFLWDVKEENFGWVGNKYMCHDYGQLYNVIHYPKKFKRINWNL